MNTQELENKVNQLESQLDAMRDVFNMLSQSSSFPRDVETAIRQRLFPSGATPVSSTGVPGAATTQNISINSTPATITVPAQPTGTVPLIVGGLTYNILYK